MRVLVIDDDECCSMCVIECLREAGHQVEYSGNARDGLLVAFNKPFDVIILDRSLPDGIDGLRVLEILRADDNHTPVLVVSGRTKVIDQIAGFKAGSDDYLAKPFALSDLLARVEHLGKLTNSLSAPVGAEIRI